MSAGLVQKISRNLRRRSLPGLALLAIALAGCATLPQQSPVSDDELTWILSGADMLPASSDIEDLAALMHVTEEMRQFAQNVTRRETRTADKTTALAAALGAKDGLHLQYDANATLTAEEVFNQRRANCLSYTLLFVALAREVGIPVMFNEVDVPPTWDMGDDKTLLLYKHINARVNLSRPLYQMVDVSGDEYDPRFDQRIISDLSALAQFYNNRSVELRLQQRRAEALAYQLRALQLAPDAAYFWTNLASLYLLNGNPLAARVAVTRALTLDAASVPGTETAAQIYQQLGEHHLAAYFRERAQHFLGQNAYYHYHLALAALNEGDERLAYNETHRAIVLYPRDARFFLLAAVLLQRLGEPKLANNCMQIVIELTQSGAQQERYKNKFERLTKHG